MEVWAHSQGLSPRQPTAQPGTVLCSALHAGVQVVLLNVSKLGEVQCYWCATPHHSVLSLPYKLSVCVSLHCVTLCHKVSQSDTVCQTVSQSVTVCQCVSHTTKIRVTNSEVSQVS